MEEFFSFVMQSLIWYFVFSFLFNFIKHRSDKNDEQLQEFKKKLDEIIHRVKLEKHGEIYYWFDADDDEFLGQGKDIEEAVEQIKKRFPKHIFLLVDKENQYKLHGPEWKLVPFPQQNVNQSIT